MSAHARKNPFTRRHGLARRGGELAGLVDSMMDRGLSARQIWRELMDSHAYLIAYHSIRHYIRHIRSRDSGRRKQARTALTSNSVGPGLRTTHDSLRCRSDKLLSLVIQCRVRDCASWTVT